MIDIRQPAQSTLPPERWMELMIWGHHAPGFVFETATVRHSQGEHSLEIDPAAHFRIEGSFDETFGLPASLQFDNAAIDRAEYTRARWGHD